MDVMGELCDMKEKTEKEKTLCLLIGPIAHGIGRFEQFRFISFFLDRGNSGSCNVFFTYII